MTLHLVFRLSSALQHMGGGAMRESGSFFFPLFFSLTSGFLALKRPPPQLTRYDTNQSARSSPRIRLLRPIRAQESAPSVAQSVFFNSCLPDKTIKTITASHSNAYIIARKNNAE